ncbi:MAG: flagellar biosynthetic protein FliO [Proteobacteria bacterium]|nr:flagellar biosynthetic protein FliO [Pseudomonadota bacterium]
MPSSVPPVLSAVLALAVVLGLIGLATAAARRPYLASRLGLRAGRRRNSPGPLALEASFALDPRRRVLLLRCADRQVLLLTGGPQDLLLGWLPAGTAPAAGSLPAASLGPTP